MTEFKRGRKQEQMEITVEQGFTLKDFFAKIEKMMAGFDPEYIEQLEIEFNTYYGEYEIRMTLQHWRPETDAEMNERAGRILQVASAKETKERALLAQLLERYGG